MARTLKCDTIMVPGSQAANITMSSSVTNFGTIDVDINGGTINGCTLNNNSITVPQGNTLHISQADSLTTSTAQNDYIITNSTPFTLSNNNNDVEIAGDLKVTGNNIKDSGGGNTITMDGSNNVNILGGLTVTGNTIKSSGTGTALTLSNADVTVGGDLTVSGNDIKGGNATMNFKPDGTNTEMSIDTSGNLTIEGVMTVKGGEFLNTTNSTSATAKSFEFSTNFGTDPSTQQQVRMSLENDGDLIVAGDITAFGTPSDERMKENISPLVANDIIQNFMGFNVRQFTYKEEYQSHAVREGTQIGFIAQEVEKILPEAVQTKEDGMKAINYDVLVAVLFSVIQELYIRAISMNTSLVKEKAQSSEETL